MRDGEGVFFVACFVNTAARTGGSRIKKHTVRF